MPTAAAPLASTSRPANRIRPQEVDAFVDALQVPAALRDPFTHQLLSRPVALCDAVHGAYDICASEHSLRALARATAPERPRARHGADGLRHTQLVRHRPRARQLRHFYDDVRAHLSGRLPPAHPRRLAFERYLDASELLLCQPLVPLVAADEVRALAAGTLVPLERAQHLSAVIGRLVQRLLLELQRPDSQLVGIERRRRRLVHDLAILRGELGRARRMMAPSVMPLAALGERLLPYWTHTWGQLRQHADTFEVVLQIDVPYALGDRAREQQGAALFALRAELPAPRREQARAARPRP